MEKKLLIAGGNVRCKTPPFLFVSKDNEDKILREDSKIYQHRKFYVITTKAYVNGDVLAVIPYVDENTRDEAVRFCSENSSKKIHCYFSKVIISENGRVEKFWTEDYYMNKIKNSLRKKRNKVKKKNKKVFYNSPTIILEKKTQPIPNWLKKHLSPEHPIPGEKFPTFNLKGDIEVISSFENIAILKGVSVTSSSSNYFDGGANYRVSSNQPYMIRRDFYPYKSCVGVIHFKKGALDKKKWNFLISNSQTALVKSTGSKVFRYFGLINFYAEEKIRGGEESPEVILIFTQCNDMTKDSNGIPMEVYMRLIRKNLLEKTRIEKLKDILLYHK